MNNICTLNASGYKTLTQIVLAMLEGKPAYITGPIGRNPDRMRKILDVYKGTPDKNKAPFLPEYGEHYKVQVKVKKEKIWLAINL